MTKYQLMNEVEKRLVITEINHSLLYDSEAFKQIMSIVKKSNPTKSIKLFPNENQTN
jgi:hypothetical protein